MRTPGGFNLNVVINDEESGEFAGLGIGALVRLAR